MPTVYQPIESQPEFDGEPTITAVDRFVMALISPITATINLITFPGMLRRSEAARRRLEFEHDPVSDEEWTALALDDRAFVDETEQALMAIGFATPVRQITRSKQGIALVSLLYHREEATVASAMVERVPRRYMATSVGFQTWFADGSLVTTTTEDSPDVRFGLPRNHYHEQLTETVELDVVRRVHRNRCREFVERGVLPLGHDESVAVTEFPVDLIRRAVEQRLSRRIAMGLYEDAGDGFSRPTLKGAVLFSWTRLPPFSGILQWRARRRARQLIARYGNAT